MESPPRAALFVGAGFFDTPGQADQVVATLSDSGFGTALLEVHFTEDGGIRSTLARAIQEATKVAGSLGDAG